MKYRAQHWKDVPGVKYPEPEEENTQVPPEGWVTGREAAEMLGWQFRRDISARLRKKGLRREWWQPVGGWRQLVWCAADVANAQNARKNAREGKVASVPVREDIPPCQVYAKVGKKQL